MKPPDDSTEPRLDRFDEALRRWAQRPTPPAPAWRAPTAAIRRPRPSWRLAAVGLAAAVAATLLLLRGAAPPSVPAPPGAGHDGAGTAAVASTDEVLVLWLDAETPLYLTLPPAADAAGAERSSR